MQRERAEGAEVVGAMIYPARECPQFQKCNAPLCPLDPDVSHRHALPGEPRCRATRRTREAIAARYPGELPTGGLKPKEVNADKRRAKWAALPPEVREARLKGNGSGNGPRTPHLAPGYGHLRSEMAESRDCDHG
jgi:hypothetical protein